MSRARGLAGGFGKAWICSPSSTPNPYDFWFADPTGTLYNNQIAVYGNAASVARQTGVLADTNSRKLLLAQPQAGNAKRRG